MTNYDKTLDHAVKNNLNVLLIGNHGVGKTATIKDCFNRHKLKWKYFSASTMDPWVDFIGVPKEKVDANGIPYLDLVRPKEFAYDEVEAVFFDELNRSHKKIRNAIMELIQFKSINGKPFKNLKIVWAAINPNDEEMEYDVDKLDPAQLDRFQIHIDVPYKPDSDYFRKNYGEDGVNAVRWWHKQADPVKKLISPRRLDYAMDITKTGGEIRYVFNDKSINVSEFIDYIKLGNPEDTVKDLLNKPAKDVKEFFENHNNLSRVLPHIVGNEKYLSSLHKYIPEEELLGLAKKNTPVLENFIIKNSSKFEKIIETIRANPKAYNKSLVNSVKKIPINPAAIPAALKIDINGREYLRSDVRVIISGYFGPGRYEMEKRIKKMGCSVSPNVSKKVTHIITNDINSGSAKTNWAKKNSIPVINEQQFNTIFPDPKNPPQPAQPSISDFLAKIGTP